MVNGITLAEIAALVHGEAKGDPSVVITSVMPPEKYFQGSISPLWEKKYISCVKPGTVLFTNRGWIRDGESGVEADDPRISLIALLSFFDEKNKPHNGVSSHAFVADDARIADNVSVADGAVIKSGVKVGRGSVIMENAVICEDTEIGENCIIEPGVVIYKNTKIGNKCVLHANCVIGCEGFGFVPSPEHGMVKIPQIGIVRLDDGVEVGACSSVDRATFGETHIGCNTKIDSHVKIGHNCEVGGYTIIVAQSGLAGSSKVGSRVIMGAQSGVGNHATIGDGCTIAGRSGVSSDVPAKSVFSGFPAREHRRDLREQASIRYLPELIQQVKNISRKFEETEKKYADD
ncbi:MAG: UDP-3-O-(3-hydroxymyristoyl)glucosamine N-acyltransferase [Synergistes sp.]|nr:UDP-3-O-(3-hydroxymyristoyl)glucosamine N-acyltransferase [Synergistes sp.]